MISGIFTIAALLGFIGVSWWAYTKHNRARFAEAERLVFEDEPLAVATASTAQPANKKASMGAMSAHSVDDEIDDAMSVLPDWRQGCSK